MYLVNNNGNSIDIKNSCTFDIALNPELDESDLYKLLKAINYRYSIQYAKENTELTDDDIFHIVTLAEDCYLKDSNGYSENHICDKIINFVSSKKYTLDELDEMSCYDILDAIVWSN